VSATRQQITDAFERLVALQGYDKANLDDLSRELRISKKTIYVHFAGKRDIYASVVVRQAEAMKAQLAATVCALPTTTERLRAAMRAILQMARTHILATGQDEWLREYEVAADAFRKANGDLLRELVQEGIDSGEFRPGDAALVEKLATAMILEYLLRVNAEPAYDRDEEVVERITRFVQ
jgi:AcrR family transcriptional regulator